MNFEELYKKYKDGSATDEEKQYVEEEIAKARALNSIIDEIDAKRVIAPGDAEKVKRARRSYGKRLAIKIVVISLACLLALSAVASISVWGIAFGSAKSASEYDLEESIELAKKCILDHTDEVYGQFIVSETDRELQIPQKLRNSYFEYEIELICGDTKYEVSVNSVTGKTRITDIDR